MTFAEKLTTVRGKLYLSQDALAKEFGISFATVNRWERGHGEPNWVYECKFYDYCRKHDIHFEEKN